MVEHRIARLWHKEEQKMYHHILGFYKDIWIVKDKNNSKKQWREKEIWDKEVLHMPFIGRYDNTKWNQLSLKEEEFWSDKGFKSGTWQGKPIIVGDIIKVIEDNKEHRLAVVRTEHTFCLEDNGQCLKDFPFHNDDVELYVQGNLFQDKHLLDIRIPIEHLEIVIA